MFYYLGVGLGVVHGWRVVRVPAIGQISNVSAFVLPESMPVTDHEGQLPMFGNENTRELLEVLRIQAQALLETSAANRKLLKRRRPKTSRKVTPTVSQARPYQPQNKEFRVWHRFRSHMMEIEAIVREKKQLEPHDKVTLDMMYEWGGPTPRTAERIMRLTYGLLPDQWPPSTWPEELLGKP